jgi:hypothetical protein
MSQVNNTTSTSTINNNNNDQGQEEVDQNLPKDLPSALEKVKELRAKRDQLLQQKEKSAKELERLTKNARLATIRSLIPRELYKHQDTYENEVEKVYNYKNITDDEIADIYQTKLRAIDLGQKRNNNNSIEQHKASAIIRDAYSHFRDVPDFSSSAAATANYNSSNKSDVLKTYELMKRIAGKGTGYR